jgi:hypothetical protein
MLYLNPLSSWQSGPNEENFSQIVSFDTYQRLVKQEMNEMHSSANSSASNSKDHFQQYYHNLSKSELSDLKGLSCSLNEMLEYLDTKDDCFTLGILSALVANELNQLNASKQRRKTGTNKASLLLIDRNLDLSTISLFHEETTFDKISNLMTNLNNESSDVQIDLGSLVFENSFKSILPGNFFHFSNDSCQTLIEQFLSVKPKVKARIQFHFDFIQL